MRPTSRLFLSHCAATGRISRLWRAFARVSPLQCDQAPYAVPVRKGRRPVPASHQLVLYPCIRQPRHSVRPHRRRDARVRACRSGISLKKRIGFIPRRNGTLSGLQAAPPGNDASQIISLQFRFLQRTLNRLLQEARKRQFALFRRQADALLQSSIGMKRKRTHNTSIEI
jgi:hypothetical protein